jgi:hypothetical protein
VLYLCLVCSVYSLSRLKVHIWDYLSIVIHAGNGGNYSSRRTRAAMARALISSLTAMHVTPQYSALSAQHGSVGMWAQWVAHAIRQWKRRTSHT